MLSVCSMYTNIHIHTHDLHTVVTHTQLNVCRCKLPGSFVVVVHSLVSDTKNSTDQPDLFTPFYSCLVVTHIVFQVMNTGMKPSYRGCDRLIHFLPVIH